MIRYRLEQEPLKPGFRVVDGKHNVVVKGALDYQSGRELVINLNDDARRAPPYGTRRLA